MPLPLKTWSSVLRALHARHLKEYSAILKLADLRLKSKHTLVFQCSVWGGVESQDPDVQS